MLDIPFPAAHTASPHPSQIAALGAVGLGVTLAGEFAGSVGCRRREGENPPGMDRDSAF